MKLLPVLLMAITALPGLAQNFTPSRYVAWMTSSDGGVTFHPNTSVLAGAPNYVPSEYVAILCEATTGAPFTLCSSGGGGTALSLTTNGTSGAATYNAGTGVLNVPQYASGFSVYPTMTIPLSANFSWLNPNSYAVTNTDKTDRLLLLVPASSTGAAFMQTAALPATPYTIDLGLSTPTAGATILAGICLKNSSGGALRTYGLRQDTAGFWYMNDQSWTSVTAPGAQNNTLNQFVATQIFFIRVTDDGTNRKTYWSTNGKDYELWLSQASGTGLSPNQVGIHFYNSFSLMETVSVYHWLISTSILPQYAN